MRANQDNRPTKEYLRKMGDLYRPPAIDQNSSRPYGTRRSALDFIRDAGKVSSAEYEALSELKTYMNGQFRYQGLVSSYGLQNWTGTTAGQEKDELIKEEWPLYCGQKVDSAEELVNNPQAWAALVMVLYHDKLFVEVGESMGYFGKNNQTKRASRWFKLGTERLMSRYRLKSDYAQHYPPHC
jgi:hypothetical protein